MTRAGSGEGDRRKRGDMGAMENQRAAETIDVGTTGKYQSFAKLGSGGMGDVVLAVARGPVGFNKLVVLKRLRAGMSEEPAFVSMFLDEARLAARLNHPNIVHTYEVGADGEAYFIAMEYLEGQPLARIGRTPRAREVFTPAMWAHVIAKALAGLHYAHELADYDGTPLRVVHRDVSPQNIFVTYSGDVKLVDFGIAKAELNSTRTASGVLKGKLSYMAPEQAHGEVDRRSDLFAMGAVLWEMLVGRKLFVGDSGRILNQLLNDFLPLPSSLRASVPPELDAIVARALEKDPAARYQTAEEMAEALEAYVRASGEIVRDATIGAAVTSMFQDLRQHVQQRIREHMARPVDEGIRLPTLTESLPLDGAGESPGVRSRRGRPPDPRSRRLLVATEGRTGAALAGAAARPARRRRRRMAPPHGRAPLDEAVGSVDLERRAADLDGSNERPRGGPGGRQGPCPPGSRP